MDTIRLYLHSVRMLMKSRLQYPVSFTLQTLAQLVMEGGEMMAVLLLIDRFGGVKGWNGGELLMFFGIMSVTFYLTEIFGRGITGGIEGKIRSGKLDVIMIRPRGVLTQILCEDVDPRRISCIAVGVTALIMGSGQAKVQWTFLKGLALTEGILFGCMMVVGLFLIEAIFCIHSVKSLEVVNVLTYGGRSACEYPIDLFPRPIQIIFSIVAPFSMTLHAPMAYILDKPLFGWPAWTAFLCPVAGAVTFGVLYMVFRKALQYYRSTGS